MKYKVGDKVVLRNDLIVGVSYCNCLWFTKMNELKGSVITIKYIYANRYLICEDDQNYYNDEMIDGYYFKIGDEIEIPLTKSFLPEYFERFKKDIKEFDNPILKIEKWIGGNTFQVSINNNLLNVYTFYRKDLVPKRNTNNMSNESKTITVKRDHLINYLNIDGLCNDIKTYIYRRAAFNFETIDIVIEKSNYDKLSEQQKNDIVSYLHIDIRSMFKPETNYKVKWSFQGNSNSTKADIFEKLIDKRDEINGDWKPNWSNIDYKYCVINSTNQLFILARMTTFDHLHFKDNQTAEKFLEANQELLKIYFEIK